MASFFLFNLLGSFAVVDSPLILAWFYRLWFWSVLNLKNFRGFWVCVYKMIAGKEIEIL